MIRRRMVGSRPDAGFTLLEALVALAIGGFVIAVLATITGQWMRGWRHGFPVIARAEQLVTSLDRITVDLSAALPIPAAPTGEAALFAGDETSVTYVRRTLPIERPAGLEIVRLAPLSGASEVTLARSRSLVPFGSYPTAPSDTQPVTLLRAPLALRFSYADADGQWRPAWSGIGHLPRRIRVAVVDRRTGQAVLAPGVIEVRVEAPAACVTVASAKLCDAASGLPQQPIAAASSELARGDRQ